MRKADFERVDEEGNLILSVDGTEAALEVSDALEEALLSSRKIKARAAIQKRLSPLPVSQIQSMLRAGTPPDRIAKELNAEESLVSKIAGPVENEKRAAIRQFMSGFCRKTPSGKGRAADLIFRSLSELGVKKSATRWSAAREGRGPWTVTAEFEAGENRWSPSWSWDGRDNSVSPLNEEAEYLLEENPGKTPPLTAAKRSEEPPLPSQKPQDLESPKISKAPEAEANEEAEGEREADRNPKPRIAFQPKGKMQRKGVPSWDDILFGGGVTSTGQSEES